MAQRKNVFTVNSEEVQGEGSFVKLRALTWEQNNEIQAAVAEAAGGVMPTSEEQVRITTAFLKTNNEMTIKMLNDCVIEWDWVDDDGKLMPLPKDGGIGKLSTAEIQFIVKALQPKTQAKN